MIKKQLVLVFGESSAPELLESLKKHGKEITVVCANDEIKTKLVSLGYECKTLGDYYTSSSDSGNSELQRSMSWIQRWPDTPVLRDRSFKELLVYNGISIYWFLLNRLYLLRMKELLVLVDRIKKIIAVERAGDVIVIGNTDAKYIVSKIMNIAQLQEKQKLRSRIRYKSYQGFPFVKLLLLKLFRGTFIPSIGGLRKPSQKRSKILVVTETKAWRDDFDFETHQYVRRDVYLHEIIRQLSDKGHDVLIVDFENRAGRLFKAISDNIKRQKSFGVPVIAWEKYINLDILWKSRKVNNHFMRIWKELANSDCFTESLTYCDVPLYELIKNDLQDLFRSLKAYASVAFIEAAERIIEAEKPQAVLMHDEYGALQLSFLNAAKKRNIPTISLQHGLISEDHIAYVHDPSHITGDKKELLFPLPDKMCVWSESVKRRLLKVGSFPQSIPVVTGDPKTDFLKKAIDLFDYERITSALNIPKERRIILFATENLYSVDEKVLITKTVYKALKAVPECFLVVKLHPNEEDVSFYHQLAKAIGLTELTIVKNSNLYELLYVADLVVLSFSTVGAETMRIGKPVISLNLEGLHNEVSFIKNKMAIVVEDAADLVTCIKQCLNNDNSELIDNAKKYAEEELGEIDGNAASRIVHVVSDCIELQNLNKSKGTT